MQGEEEKVFHGQDEHAWGVLPMMRVPLPHALFHGVPEHVRAGGKYLGSGNGSHVGNLCGAGNLAGSDA